MDAEGGSVSGKVSLNYRQFQDVGEIFLSGLSMHFDSAGLRSLMRSTGMMEIRGSQGGKPIFLAQGKSLSVAMASFTDEDDHRLYYLNEEDRRWGERNKDENARNSEEYASPRRSGVLWS